MSEYCVYCNLLFNISDYQNRKIDEYVESHCFPHLQVLLNVAATSNKCSCPINYVYSGNAHRSAWT
jgi:hypothetical protein